MYYHLPTDLVTTADLCIICLWHHSQAPTSLFALGPHFQKWQNASKEGNFPATISFWQRGTKSVRISQKKHGRHGLIIYWFRRMRKCIQCGKEYFDRLNSKSRGQNFPSALRNAFSFFFWIKKLILKVHAKLSLFCIKLFFVSWIYFEDIKIKKKSFTYGIIYKFLQ